MDFSINAVVVDADAIARAEPLLRRGHVTKPVFSREGAGVVIHEGGRETDRAPDDSYSHHPQVVQALAPLPAFDDNYIWALEADDGSTIVVDPGDAQPVLAAAEQGF